MSKEIIELLKNEGQWHDDKGCTFALVRWANYIQALILLKQPKCKTCGDTKEVLCDECGGACVFPASASGKRAIICHKCNLHGNIPCSDCQQPTAGEFTMRFRAYLDGEYRAILLEPSKSMNRPEVQILLKKQLLSEAKGACNLIDTAEAINKDLLEACEGLMERADNGAADFDDPEPGSIYLRAKAAIAKAKKEGDRV